MGFLILYSLVSTADAQWPAGWLTEGMIVVQRWRLLCCTAGGKARVLSPAWSSAYVAHAEQLSIASVMVCHRFHIVDPSDSAPQADLALLVGSGGWPAVLR